MSQRLEDDLDAIRRAARGKDGKDRWLIGADQVGEAVRRAKDEGLLPAKLPGRRSSRSQPILNPALTQEVRDNLSNTFPPHLPIPRLQQDELRSRLPGLQGEAKREISSAFGAAAKAQLTPTDILGANVEELEYFPGIGIRRAEFLKAVFTPRPSRRT